MILRPATPADVPALAKIGQDSFVATFGRLYRPEDLAAFLDEAHSEDAVLGEVTNPHCTYRLAEIGGELVGYCKMRHPSGYDGHSNARNPIALAQLYTAPGRTGEGIGAALMDWAIDHARQRGCDAIQLSVYAENFGAQRFYQRYGFAKIADITFTVGEHVDPEFLFELNLERETAA